jgi:voltage-gated sodium channel
MATSNSLPFRINRSLSLALQVLAGFLYAAHYAAKLRDRPPFHHVMTVVILIAGVLVCVETQLAVPDEVVVNPAVTAAGQAVLAVFTVEVVVKLVAEGLKPWHYFADAWNCFDFVIVAACFVFMAPALASLRSLVQMLRLLRLLRVLKLIEALPELRILCVALVGGLGSIFFVFVILFIYFYIFAIVGMLLFKENDPTHFDNLQLSLISLYRVATFDGWSDLL